MQFAGWPVAGCNLSHRDALEMSIKSQASQIFYTPLFSGFGLFRHNAHAQGFELVSNKCFGKWGLF